MTIDLPPRIDSVTFEHYKTPLGIGHASPRISWKLEYGTPSWYQAAYEVQVEKATSKSVQSFSVRSDASVLVPWPAAPLSSRERAHVRIRAQSTDGVWTQWAGADVEAGLLEEKDWSATFNTTSPAQPLDQVKRPFRLRQRFTLPNRENTDDALVARLYVTALGVYESSINNVKVGEDILAPGWTSYQARLAYQTHDVSELLKDGENVLTAWVAEGWYSGRLGYQGGSRNCFGDRLALLAQLEINGQPVESTWEWAYGAITNSEIYDGETVDTRLDDHAAGLDWHPTERLAVAKDILFSTQSPPIRAVQSVRPIEIIQTPSGKTVIDFGQNLGGVVRLLSDPPSEAGAELTIRHAEVLEHGELGIRPLRFAQATDRIILGGGRRSLKGYMPKFTFHGFRYAEVTGWPGITLDDLEAVVLQSSMARTGTFECSHPLVNRLHENAVWSTMGNTIGIPSDCPQRDERLGWTGDVCVYSPTMSYLFDSSGFLAEYLQDLWHDQRKLNGVVPIFVPDTGTDVSTPEAIWGDAAVLVPYDVYQAHGDAMVLERQFESAKMWLEQGVQKDPATGLWSRARDQLGDWLAPRAPPETPNMGPTDNHLVADAWLVHSTRSAAKIARVIGKDVEAASLETAASQLTEAFYTEYVTASGRLVSETQTALCLILHFDIYPSDAKLDYKSIFSKRLAQLVAKANWLIDTGFAGTPIVLPTLAENGHLSHAYRMLQATECPSWLSTVLLGATTIWERWDSMLSDGSINPGEMTSFNHYALGSVASFMHQFIGGLSAKTPGWKEITIRPQPGGTITSARTSHDGPYGRIEVAWEIVEGHFILDVIIPPNSTADVILPNSQKTETVNNGTHHFTVPYQLPSFPPPVYVPHFAPIRPNNWAA